MQWFLIKFNELKFCIIDSLNNLKSNLTLIYDLIITFIAFIFLHFIFILQKNLKLIYYFLYFQNQSNLLKNITHLIVCQLVVINIYQGLLKW